MKFQAAVDHRLGSGDPRGDYHSRITPKAVLATLSAFETRYDLPLVYCPTPQAAALLIESWAYWMSREVLSAANDLLRGADARSTSANDCVSRRGA